MDAILTPTEEVLIDRLGSQRAPRISIVDLAVKDRRLDLSSSEAQAAVNHLADVGLIERPPMGARHEIPLALSAAGVRLALSRKDQSRDVLQRRLYSRNAVLRVLYHPGTLQDLAREPSGYFFGSQLDEDDIQRAVDWLMAAKLIERDPSRSGPELTSLGLMCIEQSKDVTDFMTEQIPQPIAGIVIHENHGQLVISGRDSVGTTQQEGPHAGSESAVFRIYAEALREFASVVALGERQQYHDLARDLEAASPEDASATRSLMTKGVDMLMSATGLKGLGQVLAVAFKVYETTQGDGQS